MSKQKKINLDNQFKACWKIRKEFPEEVNSIIDLIKKIEKMDATDFHIIEFLSFLKDLANEKYGKQQNNHNLMKTFLKEKINSHDRIQYNLLEGYLTKGYLPYAKNVSPKSIMSNYFFSNEVESLINVHKLETAFKNFTWSDRCYLSDNDEFIIIDVKD